MMEKVDRFDASECSPKSPFQFGLMKGLFHNVSYSASSCSFDTDYEEDQAVTFNSTKPHVTAPSSFKNFSLEELKSTQSHLSPTMKRAHELQVALHQSHARVQGIMNRASLLDIAISPLAFQASKAKRIEDHMDKATQPAKIALRVFQSMQKLQGTLSVGPLQDVGFIVEALSQFQQHMNAMLECGPMVIQALGEGVAFLKGSRLVDRFHMEELFEVINTLQSLLVGQEHLAMPRHVVDQAIEHLISAFQRIIRDYVKPMDLSQCMTELTSERRIIAQPRRLLPTPVLQTLQGIVEMLAFNDNFEDCLQVYEAERGYQLKESLQTLQSDSYLCYQTTDAINLIEWASLEEQLGTWAQHLEVFVSVLLSSEYTLCKKIFSQVRPDGTKHWKDGFGRMVMQVGLALFIKFGEAFTKSHMEPQKLFKLLDMFDCLENLKPKFEEMFDGGGMVCRDIHRRIWSLNRGVVEGVAQVLKQMKYRVEKEEGGKETLEKSIGMSKGGAVLKLVSYTVNYLKYMLSEWYKPLISKALEAEQSLNKERYEENTDASTFGAGDNDEEKPQQQQLLYTAVLGIMQALDKTLAATAQRLLGVRAYAGFFLMNNYSYIYTRCLKSDVGTLLGEDWLQKQLDKMELCAMQYKQEAWGHLIALINCEGLSSSFNSMVNSGSSVGRELIRQRAKAFQASLHNLVASHSAWFIPNEDLRKRICHDVLQSVIPAYRSFLETYSHFLSPNHLQVTSNGANRLDEAIVSNGPQTTSLMQLDNTIIKYTPEIVERMLTSIFEMRFQPHHLHSVAGQISSTNMNKHTSTRSTSGDVSDNESVSQTSYSDGDSIKISSKKFRFVHFHKS